MTPMEKDMYSRLVDDMRAPSPSLRWGDARRLATCPACTPSTRRTGGRRLESDRVGPRGCAARPWGGSFLDTRSRRRRRRHGGRRRPRNSPTPRRRRPSGVVVPRRPPPPAPSIGRSEGGGAHESKSEGRAHGGAAMGRSEGECPLKLSKEDAIDRRGVSSLRERPPHGAEAAVGCVSSPASIASSRARRDLHRSRGSRPGGLRLFWCREMGGG